MKLVQYELLQKLWQNTRNVFVFENMKKDDASGIGTVLFKSSGSSDLMLIGSINSPKKNEETRQKSNHCSKLGIRFGNNTFQSLFLISYLHLHPEIQILRQNLFSEIWVLDNLQVTRCFLQRLQLIVLQRPQIKKN